MIKVKSLYFLREGNILSMVTVESDKIRVELNNDQVILLWEQLGEKIAQLARNRPVDQPA